MKFSNDPSIIKFTHLVIKENQPPYRLVLRKLPNGEWTTHHETMVLAPDGETWVHDGWLWGNYFEAEDSHHAYYDFGERSIKL